MDSDEVVPKFKSFVSETELDEKRQKRQEEWDKVRKPDEPLEAPEEECDGRSLFDKLKQQTDSKQEDYEEQFKLKNQVRGLDEDEAKFLDYVSEQQEAVTRARHQEDERVLYEYKNAIINSTTTVESKTTEKKLQRPHSSNQPKKSQLSMLAGAVKRKSSTDISSPSEKKPKSLESTSDTTGDTECAKCLHGSTVRPQTAKVVAILPGLGAYNNSSDSESSSSDSDIHMPDMINKKCHCVVLEHQ